ncbi:MAG TPA: substrate-binding domain-containing protein [Symbiobacteriaceae bacterium]|nr:substrate-binding domain-containing protein [Symbiobacteriaceae bacterium]
MSRRGYDLIGLSMALVLVIGCGRTSGRMTIAGSTSAMFPIGVLAEVYEKQGGEAFAITPVGSTAGILALERGMAALGMIARPLLPEEKARGLREIPIGHDVLVVVVHPSNPVNNLRKDDLRQIWEWRSAYWSEFGGPRIRTLPHGREYGSGAHAIWSEVIGTTNYALPISPDGSLIRQEVMIDRRAVGYVGLRHLRRGGVKAIRVEGMAHTDPAYPLKYHVSLVVGPKSPPAVWRFVRFVRSAEGQRIVAEEGLIPLGQEELTTPLEP